MLLAFPVCSLSYSPNGVTYYISAFSQIAFFNFLFLSHSFEFLFLSSIPHLFSQLKDKLAVKNHVCACVKKRVKIDSGLSS